MRSVKLPLWTVGVADGDPGLANDVDVVSHLFDLGRFEIERIVARKDGGIGLALDLNRTANVEKRPAASADVIVRFIRFEMLIFEIILHVAAREGFVSVVVVFDVIGAKALAGVVDINVVIGDEEIALVALRALGGKLCDAAFGRRADLLRGNRSHRDRNQGKKGRRYPQEKPRRGKFPSMRVAIHAEDVVSQVSSIA